MSAGLWNPENSSHVTFAKQKKKQHASGMLQKERPKDHGYSKWNKCTKDYAPF